MILAIPLDKRRVALKCLNFYLLDYQILLGSGITPQILMGYSQRIVFVKPNGGGKLF